MPGFQFLHIETYSRKSDSKGRSTAFVLDEVARVPGASEHVPAPLPPVVVHGLPPDQIRLLHDDRVSGATCVTKAGKAKRVRVDQHTLLTAIASHPATPHQVRDDLAVQAEVGRLTAERQRDAFRDRWAELDNREQAIEPAVGLVR